MGGEDVTSDIDHELLSRGKLVDGVWTVNAEGVYYQRLNMLLKSLNGNGVKRIEVQNVYGQRYLGTNLKGDTTIIIHGVPGNDLGAFMSGPRLEVYGNAQDGCGNTMNDGQIIIHGRAGDITGHSMRGGKIFIRDDVGYRAGIHMKEYGDKRPYVVVGGSAQDFLGEYMAGGVLVVLGLNLHEGERHKAKFVGTGMHGGTMYIRGEVSHVANEVEVVDLAEPDRQLLRSLVGEFCRHFKLDAANILNATFSKIIPLSYRPYGKVYAY